MSSGFGSHRRTVSISEVRGREVGLEEKGEGWSALTSQGSQVLRLL